MILLITSYILGFALSYFLLKTVILNDGEHWDKGSRATALLISIGSFLSVIIEVAVVLILTDMKDPEKPVRW